MKLQRIFLSQTAILSFLVISSCRLLPTEKWSVCKLTERQIVKWWWKHSVDTFWLPFSLSLFLPRTLLSLFAQTHFFYCHFPKNIHQLFACQHLLFWDAGSSWRSIKTTVRETEIHKSIEPVNMFPPVNNWSPLSMWLRLTGHNNYRPTKTNWTFQLITVKLKLTNRNLDWSQWLGYLKKHYQVSNMLWCGQLHNTNTQLCRNMQHIKNKNRFCVL